MSVFLYVMYLSFKQIFQLSCYVVYFSICVGDRCEMFGLMMRVMGLLFGDVWIGYVNFDEFGERVIFR